MRRVATMWIAAGWMLCAVGAAVAQYTSVSPQRLIQSYDFEETNDRGVKIGRGVALPPGWYPMGRDPQAKDPNFSRLPMHDMLSRRPGFPHHNHVGYSRPNGAGGQVSHSGEFSLHLGLDGGSAGAYLEIGALPAVPRSDYLVTAKLRTERLEHAGARLLAYFIDREGRRIETSVRQTGRLRTDGEWVSIDLKLPGDFSDATYLGLQVELIQPTSDPRSVLGNHAVVLQDVDGHAWFDDLAVWQLPHVEIATQSAVNVIREKDGPEFDISVRDLIGSRLTTRVTVYDHELREVVREVRPMGWGQPSDWKWRPKLPGFGWYLTELAVLETVGKGASAEAADQPVARTYNAVLWLPQGTGAVGADSERFSMVAEGMSARQLDLLPEMARVAGLGKVVLSAWDPETTLGGLDLRMERIGSAISQLNTSARRVELSFDPVPEELANLSEINTRDAYEVFSADASLWMPYVKPFLIRQGQRIVGWRLGTARRPAAAFDVDLPQTADALREEFRHWATHPELVVPWRIDQPKRSDMPPTVKYVLAESESFGPEQLIQQLKVAGWLEMPVGKGELGECLTLQIEPEPADVVGHQGRAADLAQRMVLAWEYGAVGTALVSPWTDGMERRDALLPDPLLGVATNVANRLSGYRAVGRLNLENDRVGIIFEGRDHNGDPKVPADGMIVAWRLDANDDRANLRMHLGDRPKIYDVWGNTSMIETDGDAQFVELTDMPIFITGIDAKLALFRSSFSLDEPMIRSTQTPHQRTLRFTNPWPVTISGQYTITGPAGWNIQPLRQVFSIAPGDTFSLPVGLKFPVNEVAGDKRLTADFDFIAGRSYMVQFAAPMEVGLDNIRFEASMSLEPGKTPGTIDAIVACIITNIGAEDLSINVFASLAGHARRERLVPRLEPGQSVIRQFRIADVAKSLATNDIRTGVRETNGPAVLNHILRAEDVH